MFKRYEWLLLIFQISVFDDLPIPDPLLV